MAVTLLCAVAVMPSKASAQCEGTDDCEIDGQCYADQTPNPANSCELCDSLTSNTSWTTQPDGHACDDGAFCTINDACFQGTCSVSQSNGCSGDGIMPSCAYPVCNEATDSCDLVLTVTNPATHCLIEHKCIPSGANDEAGTVPMPSPCTRYCDVNADLYNWTFFAGTCDAGVSDGGANDSGTDGSDNNILYPNTQNPTRIDAGGSGLFCSMGPQSHTSPVKLAFYLFALATITARRRRRKGA